MDTYRATRQKFEEYTASRWPNAHKLVKMMVVCDDLFGIYMAGQSLVVYTGPGKHPQEVYWGRGTLISQMDYFEAIHLHYYERQSNPIDDSRIRMLESMEYQYLDMVLYLSEWFTVIPLSEYFMQLEDKNGKVVGSMSTVTKDINTLYDYFYQYEQRHKASARDAFRCLPLPIANEIMEYY